MNKAKWTDESIPLPILALKLTEEAAEVGTEITDAAMEARYPDWDKVITECDHVIFIAMEIRNRVFNAS